MNTAPANMILVSEFTALAGKCSDIVDSLNNMNAKLASRIYVSEDQQSILEIKNIKSFSELDSDTLFNTENLNQHLASDFRRQVLKLKKTVKMLDGVVPESKYLQLRHIEVPLHLLEEYHLWRETTIFDHVVERPEIESFLAYHSIISTEPGVMFLSGFSVDIDNYLAGFNQPSYIDIVKQAGEKYIFGGQSGLYTKIYKKIY